MQINKIKNQTIIPPNTSNDLTESYYTKEIKLILPHRAPFLFLDEVSFLNREAKLIKANRKIDEEDPIFKGHFPGNPIYPGALLQEMMFQACLALLYFLKTDSPKIPKKYDAIEAVGTKIHEVQNILAVKPGDSLEINAFIENHDDLIATGVGQIICKDRICCIGKGDFYVL